jgi:Tfp pilus assembly protein PilE
MASLLKKCSKCREEKSVELFSKSADRKDGLQRHCKQCKREYAQAWAKANPEEKLARARKFNKNNPDYHRLYQATYSPMRRALKLNATPKWLTEDDLDVIQWVYEMREERTNATGVMHHVDHIVPLKGENVCGLHVWWNMQILTATDNVRKNNKWEVSV